jgi:hypothetical protein
MCSRPSLPKAKSRRRSGGDQVFMYMSIVVGRQFPEDCSASDEFSGGMMRMSQIAAWTTDSATR